MGIDKDDSFRKQFMSEQEIKELNEKLKKLQPFDVDCLIKKPKKIVDF